MPEISIKAETLFHIAGLRVTNSMVLSLFVFMVIVYICFAFSSEVKTGKKSNLYYILNIFLRNLYEMFQSIVHDKINVFFPILSALFFWILIQNWSGLLPGVGSILVAVKEPVVHVKQTETVLNENAHEKTEEVLHVPLLRGNNADLNATLALALVSVVLVQYYGIAYLGFKTYIQKFINFSNPVNFVLGILELVSEVSKIISFAFRLFGNIFAGEVLLTIVAFLVPVLASFPFLLLEVFVGLIQALVFSMLTSVFFNLAVTHHEG